MADLTQEQWAAQLKEDSNAVIIDVRTSQEYEEGYIPNAINIDIYKGQEFLSEVEKLNKYKRYYVYCKSGGRSAQACLLMKQMGFSEAYNLLGGYMKWQGETLP